MSDAAQKLEETVETNEERIAFTAEVSKVLKLMIHSLYTNKDIFLRELISNASDACDKLRYAGLENDSLLKEDSELKIRLSFDKDAGTITIADNGIGMSKQDLVENLGTIARSGTQEFIEALTGDAKEDMPLIGQFGVGFYSSYMVADRVRVISRKAGEDSAYSWESDGNGEFVIREAGSEVPRGTSITLHLKEDESAYLDQYKLMHIAETYSDHISFPIMFVTDEAEEQQVNSASALWTRSKSELSAEKYKEFYHHVAHSPDEPWMILHNKAEGKIEYTNLLFIPSMQPFDLFHPDRQRRVKLYVKRVFITDEGIDIVPRYLRFLRGIVDSEDLPLNISRETLQHNPLLDKIRDSIVSKVLGELKKKAKKDAEGYAAFWKNFGAVLKEGLCEATTPKEKILEVCQFHSTSFDEDGALTTLDDYVERMGESQKEIYYLLGDDLKVMKSSPQLEGFKAKGVEVILMHDHVDDFWVNTVQDYKGKPLVSITRSNIDLDGLEGNKKDDKDESSETDTNESDVTALIAALKIIYGEEVKDVRASGKLTDSPVCLAVGEGDMDIRMERFLREQKQLPGGAGAKILEINPKHPVIASLATQVAEKGAEASIDDAAFLLLDQARILEGEAIADPAAFSRRLTELLSKGLA